MPQYSLIGVIKKRAIVRQSKRSFLFHHSLKNARIYWRMFLMKIGCQSQLTLTNNEPG